MNDNYTSNGRNINAMTENDIIDYLGLNDLDYKDSNFRSNIIEQAKAVENVYKNKNIDYCLKGDYELYVQSDTDVIIGNTKDLLIFIKQ